MGALYLPVAKIGNCASLHPFQTRSKVCLTIALDDNGEEEIRCQHTDRAGFFVSSTRTFHTHPPVSKILL